MIEALYYTNANEIEQFEALSSEVVSDRGSVAQIDNSNDQVSNVENQEASSSNSDLVPQPPAGSGSVSIQEAFQRRKKKFIEDSKKRQERVKGNILV